MTRFKGLLGLGAALLMLPFPVLVHGGAAAAAVPAGAVTASAVGEIERLFLNSPDDPWSGGQIVVGGQLITLPRNLLIDLPANRLSLQQLFAQAPADCQSSGESGLSKADRCNHSLISGGHRISSRDR
jgi:hypothetical protein